jgi:hypothetical protein
LPKRVRAIPSGVASTRGVFNGSPIDHPTSKVTAIISLERLGMKSILPAGLIGTPKHGSIPVVNVRKINSLMDGDMAET